MYILFYFNVLGDGALAADHAANLPERDVVLDAFDTLPVSRKNSLVS